ncbi:MAG: DUF4263 domain-containing protein [Saprospiraceae bacterium]
MEESRLSIWNEEKGYPLWFKTPVSPEFQKLLDKKKRKEKPAKTTMFEMYQMMHEIIFDKVDHKPIFHCICRVLDTTDLRLYFDNTMDLLPPENESEYEEHILNVLGSAISMEIPVYPNTDIVENELNKFYRSVIKDGFWASNDDGTKVRLRPTNAQHLSDIDFENIEKLDVKKFLGPSVVSIIREVINEELQHLSNAQKTLQLIEIGISQLEGLLKSSVRNENALQTCITENPILFGLEYKRVIPKHQLGSDYELDYALEKHSGHFDIVEIESSTLSLFNKRGDPSNHLIHAEQQVLDWFEWVDRHYGYSREKLENFYSPTGYIVIGRGDKLNSQQNNKILRRNKMFNGKVNILTYDDLLEKAKKIMEILKGQGDK